HIHKNYFYKKLKRNRNWFRNQKHQKRKNLRNLVVVSVCDVCT
ncbi:hypothetical protein M5D96_005636, partial [Drosophila gunungcola]